MTAMTLLALNGLRSVLFSSAKKRWFGGVIIGYLAVFVVPISVSLEAPTWIGATVAAALSIAGRLARAWSDSIRGDAEKLHRANELFRGIGHPIEPKTIADLRFRYSDLQKLIEKQEREQEEYHETRGEPAPRLLSSMLRESAWWTAHLAKKARNFTCVAGAVGFFIVIVVLVMLGSIQDRVYGAAICAVILVDLFNLGLRYERLREGCLSAFRIFDDFRNRNVISERDAFVAALNYYVARGSAPLLPDWLWRKYRSKLNNAWLPLSEKGS